MLYFIIAKLFYVYDIEPWNGSYLKTLPRYSFHVIKLKKQKRERERERERVAVLKRTFSKLHFLVM